MNEDNLDFKVVNKACDLFASGFTKNEIIKFFCDKSNVYPENLNPQPEGYKKEIFKNFLLEFPKYEQKEILLELCEQEPKDFHPSWPSKKERQELASLLQNELADKCEPVETLIFASKGKPDINIANVLTNKLSIVNKDSYLIYKPAKDLQCLLWSDLLTWWTETETLEAEKASDTNTKESTLKKRLVKSLNSREKKFFNIYFNNFKERLGNNFPALIPQVWVHYNRYSNEYRMKTTGQVPFFHQVVDFLLILPNKCVLIEIDGKEHYSSNDIPDEEVYASQVSYDRDLKLLYNYDVYRFGNYELDSQNAESTVVDFFEKLLINKYKIKRNTDNDLK